MKQALRYNNKVIKKIYQGDELVKKMNYGQSSDVFQYIKNDGDTPTPPTPAPYDEQYLTIESTSDNNTISLVASRTNITKTVSASTDNGNTWTEYTSSTGGTQIATLNNGDKVLVKGENSAYALNIASFMKMYNYFTSSGQFNAYGNIMSLISGDSFVNADTLTANYTFGGLFSGCTGLTSAENLILPATTLKESCYRYMFQGCTSLATAPSVLPATTLALAFNCYESMFKDCTSLTTAPQLPATTITSSCYQSMFAYCSNLTVAPELPATTMIGYYCYRYMFQGCTNLTTAPELPATTLAPSCYQSMFQGCTSLTTAPELPATTLAVSCYQSMFQACESLNYIKCLATDISARNCTVNWVYNVPSTGTFVKKASMTRWTTGSNGIPEGWTVVNA